MKQIFVIIICWEAVNKDVTITLNIKLKLKECEFTPGNSEGNPILCEICGNTFLFEWYIIHHTPHMCTTHGHSMHACRHKVDTVSQLFISV